MDPTLHNLPLINFGLIQLSAIPGSYGRFLQVYPCSKMSSKMSNVKHWQKVASYMWFLHATFWVCCMQSDENMLTSQAVAGASSKWKNCWAYQNAWKSMSPYASDFCTIMIHFFCVVTRNILVITCATVCVLFQSVYVCFSQYKVVGPKPDLPNCLLQPWGVSCKNRIMNTHFSYHGYKQRTRHDSV